MPYSSETDRKWQQRWEASGLYRFHPERADRKLYVLEMFSYPSSSNLHVGHWYNYALSDSWARMKRMQGHEIFQPMGFDAFGLPAENYAIRTGVHPKDSTLQNIAVMEQQLRRMGGMFAWDYELATCLPEYYRWNQWLFLQLYKHGLAYRSNAPVNWCPQCNTVLANEQVDDGACERCGAQVTRKNLTQWFFRITAYAQELLDQLPALDWPEKTKKIQTNWIGRSEGAELVFGAVKDGRPLTDAAGEPVSLKVFTTRADTLMGVTYVVVAPESELCGLLTTPDHAAEVEAYREAARSASDIERMSTVREKTGVFTGSYAIHPVTGEQMPVWAADYVIAGYGTGVVMAVPAHDERDYDFAVRYNLPIRRVISSADGSPDALPFVEYGVLVDSGAYDGLASADAIEAIVADLATSGKGELKINYRLRDWLVSRQRYWGTPIPIIHCDHCGVVPVPEDQLPVELPYDVEFRPDGESPLAKCASFMETVCPVCGKPAHRDPDTLDTFVCSSWYQFRYTDPHNDQEPFGREVVDRMCPVDKYIGGAEHAAMHLLYARFVTKALRDMGYLSFDEPFRSLVHQGTILGPDGQKMSKSKGNTINPDDYITRYGSDVFRTFLAFGFAYTEGGPWSDDGVRAVAKFISRIEKLVEDTLPLRKGGTLRAAGEAEKELRFVRHHAIHSVTIDADRFQFNTSIARLMELLNAIQKYLADGGKDKAELVGAVDDLLRLLAPFAPHFTEEMWELTGRTASIFDESWPEHDPAALVRDTVEIAVQLNGAIKFRIDVPTAATQDEIREMVLGDPRMQALMTDRNVVKFIYVPGRLANVVAK
ncbi:MAG: leucine--tRNA ligase [Clostridiaceae bacterium]|nr:leucine--tRNA ligase [Clostridiaceae bacterium]